MQLNKKKNNPSLNQKYLAQIITYNFNKQAYTGQKTIQWKRFWVKNWKISCTKAEKHLYVVLLMHDKNLIFFVKEKIRKTGENKNDYFIMSTNLLY